jgi:hypothetical protein
VIRVCRSAKDKLFSTPREEKNWISRAKHGLARPTILKEEMACECQISAFGFRSSNLRLTLGTSIRRISFCRDGFPVAPTFVASVPSGVTNIFRPRSTPAQAIQEVSLLFLAICAAIARFGNLACRCGCGRDPVARPVRFTHRSSDDRRVLSDGWRVPSSACRV